MSKIKHLAIPHKHNDYKPHLIRMPALLLLSLMIMGMQVVYNFTSAQEFRVLGYATNVNNGDLLINTNQQRANNGLLALNINSQLNVAAQNKAQHMIDNDYWAHNSPNGVTPWYFINNAGYTYQNAGENLAYGFSTSSGVVSGWMGSPSHAANILGDYVDVGFGIANGANFQGGQNTVVVAMYGTPTAYVPPPTDVCSNISGVQESTPSGYIRTGNICTEIPPEPEPEPETNTDPDLAPQTPTPTTNNPEPSNNPVNTPIDNTPTTQANNEPETIDDTPAEEDQSEDESDEETDEETDTPISTTINDDPLSPEQLTETSAPAEEDKVSLWNSINNGSLPWPTIVLFGSILMIGMVYLFRHVVFIHNMIIDGQKAIHGHPMLEMSIVYIAIGVVLSMTTGSIH